MAELALPQYPPFDCKSEGKSVRWAKWVSRLKNLFVGYNVTGDVRQKALLLTFGGEDLNDIVDNLPEAETAVDEGEAFKKLVEAVTKHFKIYGIL